LTPLTRPTKAIIFTHQNTTMGLSRCSSHHVPSTVMIFGKKSSS
jgi:hypothetical protein